MEERFNLDEKIRKVPDFPKPGILFYDITSVLTDPEAFRFCLRRMNEIYRATAIDAVVAVESRGFLFGAPFAAAREVPLVLARKPGKLPGRTVSQSFALEYGNDTIEVQSDDLRDVRSALIVDDLVATGGTLGAVASIVQRSGANVAGIFSVIGLSFLDYRSKIGPFEVTTLIEYGSE